MRFLSKREQRDEREYDCHDERGVELCVGVDAEGPEVEGEEASYEGEGVAQILNSEYRPTHHGDDVILVLLHQILEYF